MRTAFLVFALVLTGMPLAAQGQNDGVDAAIAAGLSQKVPGVVEVGSKSAGQFSVQIAGPLGRVAAAAARAQREGQPFTRDQVTPAMLEPAVEITVYPNDPDFRIGRITATPPAKQIVIRPRGRNASPVEALRTEAFQLAWSNGRGARLDGQGLVALFDRTALPAGDFDIVVQTEEKELRYRVRADALNGVR